jgi:hypothetical protein
MTTKISLEISKCRWDDDNKSDTTKTGFWYVE